ncbi:tyrosine--tRNA ligase [Verrucomicrobiota bacterium]|nr:tyrosine--tRNA ligase [Verrucomicrobiota bacterium]
MAGARDDFAKRHSLQHAHLDRRVPLPSPPGLRLGQAEVRHRNRRERPAVQHARRPGSPGTRRASRPRPCSACPCSSALDGEKKNVHSRSATTSPSTTARRTCSGASCRCPTPPCGSTTTSCCSRRPTSSPRSRRSTRWRPRKQLATRLTDKFHGPGPGPKSAPSSRNVFSKGGVRTDMPGVSLGNLSPLRRHHPEVGLVDLLAATASSRPRREIRRLIEGGAVKVGVRQGRGPRTQGLPSHR